MPLSKKRQAEYQKTKRVIPKKELVIPKSVNTPTSGSIEHIQGVIGHYLTSEIEGIQVFMANIGNLATSRADRYDRAYNYWRHFSGI